MISPAFFAEDWLAVAALRATGILAAIALAWRGLPACRPRLRRAVALAGAAFALAALIPVGVWQLALPWPGATLFAAERETTAVIGAGGGFSWMGLGAAIWLGGMTIAFGRWVWQARRLRALVRASRPWPSDERRRFVTQGNAPTFPGPQPCSSAAVFRDVRFSDAVQGPCVAGVWRPVLLMPSAARHWSDEEWRMVLAHESQHLRQRDLWAAWLPRLVCAVYWWHPLAHWLERQYHLESEALCDKAAVGHGHSVRPYVEFLLALSSRSAIPSLAVGMARPSRLSQRLERLLAVPVGKEPVRDPSLLAFALVLAALGLAVLRLSPHDPPSQLLSPAPQPHEEIERAPLSAEAALRLSADPFPQP